MGRRYRKTNVSPLPMASLSPPSLHESPSSLVFGSRGGPSSKSKARTRSLNMRPKTGGVSGLVASPAGKTLASVADLRDFASSSLDDLKCQLDHSHSEILKDFEASHSRLQKRYKVHPLFHSDADDSRYMMKLIGTFCLFVIVGSWFSHFYVCTFFPMKV